MSEQRRDGVRWRYRFAGEVHGPYSFDELRALAARGQLPRHAQVAQEGSEDWRDAGLMPALGDAWTAAAPPPGTAAGRREPAAATSPPTPAPTEPPPRAPAAPPVAVGGGAREEGYPRAGAEPRQNDLTLAHVVYGLYAVNFFVGFTGLIGVIIAYFKRGSAAGTWLGTHFSWQIRTFWYGLAVAIVALLLARFLGWLVVLAGGIWLIYRIVIGWRSLFARSPIGDVDPIENFFRRQFRRVSGSSSSSRS